jgi:RimJ/RimL family protein N-acetyltransferase
MANGSSSEREYALLVAELDALDKDIATARATAWRGAHPPRMQFHAHREPPPAVTGERVHLADGTEVVIRPVQPGDQHDLELGFAQLSAMSRLQRYRQPVEHLSRRELAELTEGAHAAEEGIVALDPASGACVAGARFVRSKEDPAQAEFTCTVADEWQSRGVGTALVERLVARAHALGVERFTTVILVGNEPARRLVRRIGRHVTEHREGGTIEFAGDDSDDATDR